MKKGLRLGRLAAVVASLVILVSLGLPPIMAYADNNPACSSSDIIRSLWAGSNFDLSGTNTCPETPASSGSGTGTTGYVALGDSVAAGLGLPNPIAGTDPACGVSGEAYPFIVADSTGQSVTNLACSGATAGDLFTMQNVGGHEVSAQLDRAFAHGTPSLITITAGANDLHWVDFLRKCYASQCGTDFDTAAARILRETMEWKLSWALNDINVKSNGSPPEVVVTGYYHPISAACDLAANNLTTSELTWLNNQLDLLNQAVAHATSGYSFARFAPVDFQGHELCTSDPWVQGLNDAAPFHPTAEGQQAIANDVRAKL